MQELLPLATCDTADGVIAEALRIGRKLTGADVTLAALADERGGYVMRELDGLEAAKNLLGGAVRVTPGVGLGGRVLNELVPVTTVDYPDEPSITGDFKSLVQEAGLHGLACAAATTPSGHGLLLYGASVERGAPGDRATETLTRVAEAAAMSLHQLSERRRRIDLEILRERQQLACSLHDSVAQMLFAIGVAAQQSRTQRDPDVLIDALSQIETTAAGARAELREVFARLSEPLPGLGFESLLEAEVRLFGQINGCRVLNTRDGEPRALTDLVHTLLLDTAREGLRNAAKHGRPRIATVHLGYLPSRVQLIVQAEGAFDELICERTVTEFPDGSGLDLISRRAAQVGGFLMLNVFENGSAVLRIEAPAPKLDGSLS